MAGFSGNFGDNSRSGTNGRDKFKYFQGGNDKLKGKAGRDLFLFGGEFTALDKVDGGRGFDRLELLGDYSAGVVFNSSTLRKVELIQLGAGFIMGSPPTMTPSRRAGS